MSERFVDLHTHSTASDGTDTPAQLVEKAKMAGLSALALTDHDTTAGCAEAARAARSAGIDFLPGIEISASYPRPGVMHLLGYGVDSSSRALLAMMDRLQAGRSARNRFLIEALNRAGVRLTMEDVREAASETGVIGRPHFARALAVKGYVPHPNAAYRYYLSNQGPFHFDREEPEPAEAIAAIHAAGGVVSLAHPMQLRKENFAQLATEIKSLADVGLDAVETISNDHRESFIHELETLCRKYNLLQTGGSDYHGGAKKWITLGKPGGRRKVPREVYDGLTERLGRPIRQGH